MNTELRNTTIVNLATALQFQEPDKDALDSIADNLPHHSDDDILQLMSDVIDELKTRPHLGEADTIRVVTNGLMAVSRREYPEMFPNDKLAEPIPTELLTPFLAPVFDINEVTSVIVKHKLSRYLADNTLLDFRDQLKSMLDVNIYQIDDINNRLDMLIGISLAFNHYLKIEDLVNKL